MLLIGSMAKRWARMGWTNWGLNMRLTSFLGLAIFLGCAHLPATAFSLFGPNLDPIKEMLADPYSAKFERIETLPSGIVCGDVNSKNRFGAYTGKQLFAIAEGQGYLSENSEQVTRILCIETRKCEDMKCVHKAVDKKLAEKADRDLAPQIQMVGERLASFCFSKLSDGSEAQRDCLLSLSACREGGDPSKHLKCLVNEFEQRMKKDDDRFRSYGSPGYP